jgi:hypothetical protein
MIRAFSKVRGAIWVTSSEGKTTEEGTMISTPESPSNSVAVANTPEAQTRVTTAVAANQGKKTDEGAMMWPSELKPNLTAVADRPGAQTSTPATAKEAPDILTNCKILF